MSATAAHQSWPAGRGPGVRHREVERCLQEAGLIRGPERLPLEGFDAELESRRVRRLRSALESLGPVFSAFGVYLSSRVDRLPLAVGLELSSIAGNSAPQPFSFVSQRLASELGRQPDEIFSWLDEEPIESRFFVQIHRGKLRSGEKVEVRVATADPDLLESELQALPILRRVLVGPVWGEINLNEVIGEFRIFVEQQLDGLAVAESLEQLNADTERFSLVRVPAVYRSWTTSSVVVLEWLGGTSVEQLCAAAQEVQGVGQRGLGRRICTAWLHLALAGQSFPVDVQMADMIVLENGQIALRGNGFVRLAAAACGNYRSYLVATMTHKADEARATLLREMSLLRALAKDEVLRTSWRQIVPFRDGAWPSGAGESLAERLFVQWRIVHAHGYLARPELMAFHQGLFAVAVAAHRLAPDHDALREALDESRWLTNMSLWRDTMSRDHMSEQIRQYAFLMVELPQKLDAALTLAAEVNTRQGLRLEGRAGGEKEQASTVVFAASLLALAAVAMLIRHFVVVLADLVWVEWLGTVLFLGFGFHLLKSARGIDR